LRVVSVKLPDSYIEGIDELVKRGIYTSRSDAIRAAIRELLRKELWSAKPYPAQRRVGKGLKVKVIGVE